MTPAIREIHHYKKENGGPTELAERQPEGVLGSCLGLRASRKPSEMEPLRRGLQPGLGESGARAGSARRGPGSRSCTGRGSRQPQEVTANRRGDPGAAGRRGASAVGTGRHSPSGRGQRRATAASAQAGRVEGRTRPSCARGSAASFPGTRAGRGGRGWSWPGRAAGAGSRLARPPRRGLFPAWALDARASAGEASWRRAGATGLASPRIPTGLRDAGVPTPFRFCVAGAASGVSAFVSPPLLFRFLNPDTQSSASRFEFP